MVNLLLLALVFLLPSSLVALKKNRLAEKLSRLEKAGWTGTIIGLLAVLGNFAYPDLGTSGWIAIAALTIPFVAYAGLAPERELLTGNDKMSIRKRYARRLMAGAFAVILIVYTITFLTFIFNGFWIFHPAYPPYIPHDYAVDFYAILEGLAIFCLAYSVSLYRASLPREFD